LGQRRPSVLFVFWLISLLPILFIVWGYTHPSAFFSSQEQVRDVVARAGAWAPVAFVAVQILQVIITPISHYVVGLAGGFIFGPVLGSILNWVGRVIGHTAAFAISRYVARPFLMRFVTADKLKTWDRYVSGNAFLLFLAYFLPFFPDDELSYIAGSSLMPWGPFMVANVLGQIGGSVGLALPGAGANPKSPAVIAISVATLVAAVVFFIIVRRRRAQEPSVQE